MFMSRALIVITEIWSGFYSCFTTEETDSAGVLAQNYPPATRERGSSPVWPALSVLLFSTFRKDEVSSSPSVPTHNGEGQAVACLARVQPKGRDSLSSFSAGSQHARGWLETPSQGLLLQQGVGWGQ